MSYLAGYYSPIAGMVSKRSLNIVVNTRMLVGDRLDGIARLTYEVMHRLAKLRPNDHFYCLYDRYQDQLDFFGENVENVIVWPPARHPLLWKIWFDWRIPKILKKLKADCFISLDGFNSRQTNTPSIIVGHDIAPLHFQNHMRVTHRWYFNRYLPKFLKNADAIVANSHFTKQDICETLDVKHSKVHVAYSGLNPRFIPINEIEQMEVRKRFTDEKPYFVFVGTRSPRKNLVRLVQAYDIFRDETSCEHHLMIIGKSGWKDKTFIRVTRSSKYRSSIHLLESVGNEDIFKLVGAAEAAVFVSLHEGFGLPIIEAMSAGIPVICSNISAMPEVAGDSALFVNPKSISDISEAMKEITQNEDLRNDLIHKGLQNCQKFSWDDQANLISKLVDELIGRHET